MSYNGILPDFSICSGVEVLLYLPRSLPWPLAAPAADCPGRLPHRPAQKPPDPAAAGPPRPLPGPLLPRPGRSSARRPPTPPLCRSELPPGVDWVKREKRRKQERKEKTRGEESARKRK
ncbi:hypothetical protein PVAP13_1KG392305 [Panicum virgatum]|uniref:Uncharacterized protein n=1 Tax=Panicum virgatum TaxID=38727 RepID=A0A8T0XXN2_PANVG|nr:hypothetical protein PVAP13_1KG392305 [Panicum virgatum]